MSRVEQIGRATLYLGDCRDVIPTVTAHSLITDPPYGVSLGTHDGAAETRKGWLTKAEYESYEDTEDNLVAIVIPAIEMALKQCERGLVFCADRHIHKFPEPVGMGGVYVPSAVGRGRWGFASLAHCLFYGAAPDLHKGAKATAIRSSETAEKNGHPCPKPVGWMKWAVNLSSREGETVLDPFLGSGTTGVAAVTMGRDFIGCEIEPKYFDIACKRIEDAQRQSDMFIGEAA